MTRAGASSFRPRRSATSRPGQSARRAWASAPTERCRGEQRSPPTHPASHRTTRRAVDHQVGGLLRPLPYAVSSDGGHAWDNGTTGVRGWMRACRAHRSPSPFARATKEEREVMIGTILMALVAGAIVGPLARLVLPGRQNMGVLLTVVLGALGSLIGAFIYYKATGVSD